MISPSTLSRRRELADTVRRQAGLARGVDVCLLHTLVEGLCRAADLSRDLRDRGPLRGVLQHHPDGALTHLRRELRGRLESLHGSNLAGSGASGKPGAFHFSGPVDRASDQKLTIIEQMSVYVGAKALSPRQPLRRRSRRSLGKMHHRRLWRGRAAQVLQLRIRRA